jgi:hypothetical protein
MADEYGSYKDKAARVLGTRGELLVLRGCCIRFDPGTVHSAGWFDDGGPYVHANSAHIALGVKGVSVESDGDLAIECDGMAPVVSCSMSGDETISVRGIFGGASVGTPLTIVRFYKVGTGRLYLNQQAGWDAIAGSLNNLWCSWLSIEERGA